MKEGASGTRGEEIPAVNDEYMHTHSIIKDAETKIELISDEKKVYTCVDYIYFSGYHGIW